MRGEHFLMYSAGASSLWMATPPRISRTLPVCSQSTMIRPLASVPFTRYSPGRVMVSTLPSAYTPGESAAMASPFSVISTAADSAFALQAVGASAQNTSARASARAIDRAAWKMAV